MDGETRPYFRKVPGSNDYEARFACPECGHGGTLRLNITMTSDKERFGLEEPLAMLTVGGKRFRCRCGSNVFRKTAPGEYACNACGEQYQGTDGPARAEPAEPTLADELLGPPGE